MFRTAAAAWLGLVATAAWGQINYFPEELATNDDGSRLLFTTSLRLRESEQHFFPKIFLLEAGSFRLLARREFPESLMALGRPEMSGNGAIVAYMAESLRSQPTCGYEQEEGVVTGMPERPEMRLPGRVKLSRNGRFALLYRRCRSADLLDLASGELTPLLRTLEYFDANGTGRRAIASDGTAVLAYWTHLSIARRTGLTVLNTSAQPWNAVIDDLATTIVYETPGPSLAAEGRRGRILLLDLGSGTEREIAGRVGESFDPALSNDGQLVVFRSWTDMRVPQVFIIKRDGSGLRQLSDEPDGIAKFAFSGDGRVVYALTIGGLLRRIEVASGEVRDVAGRVPRVRTVLPPPVPGSTVRVLGQGLADQPARAAPPLPSTLGGVRISIGGIAAPLLSVSPVEIWAQIPWDAPAGASVDLETGAVSPFEDQSQPIRTVENMVGFHSPPVHSDFRGLVTNSDPALPGEILHVYMGGLGSVDRPVPSGDSSPWNPPAMTLRPPTCRFRQYVYPPAPSPIEVREWPAEILFAGLAPGMVGIYQVSLRTPLGPFTGPYPPVASLRPDMWLWCQYELPPATLQVPILNFNTPPRVRR